MKTYTVTFTMHGYVTIKARNEQEAEEKFECLDDSDLHDTIEDVEIGDIMEE